MKIGSHQSLLLGVLGLAAVLRFGTFAVEHDNGDQLFYTAVAMKLDGMGLAGYSLREVTLLADKASGRLFFRQEPTSGRSLLEKMKANGMTYYDEPLFYAPPLFPLMIRWSHSLLAGGRVYALASRDGQEHLSILERLQRGFSIDLYAAILPYFFSLLTMAWLLLVFEKIMGFEKTAWAGLILAFSPVDIHSSNRIWADSPATFFSWLSLVGIFVACKKKNTPLLLAAGLAWGLALLCKMTVLTFGPVVGLYYLWWANRGELSGKPLQWKEPLLRTILFAGAAGVLVLPWFWRVTQVFGNPFHAPSQPGIELTDVWFEYAYNRPWYTYPVDAVVQNPLFLFSVAGGFSVVSALKKNPQADAFGSFALLLILWAAVHFAVLSAGFHVKSENYMLPIYPCLAFLAAQGIHDFRTLMLSKVQPKTAGWVLRALMGGSFLWSFYLAWTHIILLKKDWIGVPF